MRRLLERLAGGRPVLMDGAMGTLLRGQGAGADECLERWNLTRPADVRAAHRRYVEAGAECLLTHTFQANPQALARHGLRDQLDDIWRAALAHARREGVPVLADVGPLTATDRATLDAVLHPAFDADGILLETWSSTADLRRFARRYRFFARQGRLRPADVPLLVSFTFRRAGPDRRLQTFTGESPADCARAAARAGVAALGANCGAEIDGDDLCEILFEYRGETDRPLFVRPNAGTPVLKDGALRHPRGPAALAADLPALVRAGAAMVGGCCGTTPAHVAAFRAVLDAPA